MLAHAAAIAIGRARRVAASLLGAIAACGMSCGAADSGRSLRHDAGDGRYATLSAEPDTIDDSTRWMRWDLPFAGVHGAAITFSREGVGLLVLANGIARSTDSGRTWELVRLPVTQTRYTEDAGERFVDLDTARRTWFLAPTVDDAFRTLGIVIAGARLYAIARGRSSTRLGSTVLPHAEGTTFNRVFFRDGPRGACLGTDGLRVFAGGVVRDRPVLFVTTDGGENWRIHWEGAPETVAPVSITFLDTRHALLLLADGSLLRTLDGCASWLPAGALPLDASGEVTAIAWADERMGYAVGRRGRVLATRDGGRTWLRCHAPTIQNLNAVVTVPQDTAWAVGDRGTIIGTTNGGATWRLYDLAIGEDLYSVAYAAGETWLVGDGCLWTHREDRSRQLSSALVR
jgi:photosystem II stability/assembly factor-like uncharacterized protein